jgi:hypothetical protein
MNVETLQQFLRSLIAPLRASGSAAPSADSLEAACGALAPFGNRTIAEFGQFLMRCQDYERQGHWPSRNPSIAGELLDEPTAAQYAERLQAFLRREVVLGALSDRGRQELAKLQKAIDTKVLQEVAKDIGVPGPASKKPQLMNQIVQRLTGLSLTAKKSTTTKEAVDDSAMHALAQRLQQSAGKPELEMELTKLKEQKPASLKSLAGLLGVKSAPKTGPAALAAIRALLTTPPLDFAEPVPRTPQVDRCAEIVRALKAKAELPGATEEEIEAELRSLELQMDRETALAVCANLAIGRNAKSQREAFDAIRRKVFELRRARESIAY